MLFSYNQKTRLETTERNQDQKLPKENKPRKRSGEKMIDKPGKRLLVKPPLFYWFGTNDILIHVYFKKKILLISPFTGNLIYHTIEKAIKKKTTEKKYILTSIDEN